MADAYPQTDDFLDAPLYESPGSVISDDADLAALADERLTDENVRLRREALDAVRDPASDSD